MTQCERKRKETRDITKKERREEGEKQRERGDKLSLTQGVTE